MVFTLVGRSEREGEKNARFDVPLPYKSDSDDVRGKHTGSDMPRPSGSDSEDEKRKNDIFDMLKPYTLSRRASFALI